MEVWPTPQLLPPVLSANAPVECRYTDALLQAVHSARSGRSSISSTATCCSAVRDTGRQQLLGDVEGQELPAVSVDVRCEGMPARGGHSGCLVA